MDCLDVIIIAEASFVLVCNIELAVTGYADELKEDLVEQSKFVRTLGIIFYSFAFLLNYFGVGRKNKNKKRLTR